MLPDAVRKPLKKSLFIVVPSRLDKYNNTHYPPLGVLYIAATLEANGLQAEVLDASLDKLSDEAIVAEIRKRRPDAVGLTCTTHTRLEMRDVAAAIRKSFPDMFLFAGGPHVSFTPEDTLQHTALDMVVIGEGEMKTLDLLSGKPLEEIPGLAFRNGSGITINPDRGFIKDLNALPPPARHQVDMARYPGYSTLKRRTTHILSNRGCPFGCIYCCATHFWGKITRSLSAEKVLSEIETIVTDYGIRALYFYDDAFTADRKKAEKICKAMIEKKLGLIWGTSTRIDLVNPEILNLMARAGCRQIDYGLETLNPQAQAKVGTKASFERARDTIRMTVNAGIKHVKVYLIIGLPGDTPRNMRETFAKTLSTTATEVSTQILRVYPGTPIENLARERGIIPDGFSWYDDFAGGWSMYASIPEFTEWPRDVLEKQYVFLSKYLKISGAVRQRVPRLLLPLVARIDPAVFRFITNRLDYFDDTKVPIESAKHAEAASAACHK
ncbi:MAG TPA: radical SAM protein [Planctomycetota bacterium]|nr:radical SAM protein [Planctomycetota bacterium]